MLAHPPGATERDVTSPSVLRIRLFFLLLLPGVLAGLAVAMMVAAPPASADELIFASPSQDEQLHNAPYSVQLSFAALVRANSTLDVRGPDGSADLGKERRVGVTLTQRLRSGLPAGAYTVSWDVKLQNGNVSTGEYVFTVTTGSDPEWTPWTTMASDTPTTTAEPSPRWTPSTVAEQTSQAAAMIAPTNTPTSSGTGEGNVAIGLFSLLAAAGISGILFFGWRAGWWVQHPASATSRSRQSTVETSELPPINPYDD